MKNNKGFSLVELIVAIAILAIVMLEVFTLMANSSTLYRNGSMDVDLQAEAQQIVQQMEDLMIDVNDSISYNKLTANADNITDVITISSNTVDDTGAMTSQVIYTIELQKADDQDYGNLLFSMSGTEGTVNRIIMGEYVESISFNAVSENNVMVMDIAMRNQKYSYATTQDVYLRNNIFNQDEGPKATGGRYKYEIFTLRYHDWYNLTGVDYNPEGKVAYYMVVGDASNTNKTILEQHYDTNVDSNGHLTQVKVNGTYNGASHWSDAKWSCMLQAYDSSDHPIGNYIIQLTTEPVDIANTVAYNYNGFTAAGYADVYCNPNSASGRISVADIRGVDISRCTKASYEAIISHTYRERGFDGEGNPVINEVPWSRVVKDESWTGSAGSWTGFNIGGFGIQNTQDGKGTNFNQSYSCPDSLNSRPSMDNIQLDGLKIYPDAFSGAMFAEPSRFCTSGVGGFSNFIEYHYNFYFQVKLEFANGAKMSIKFYPYTMSSDSTMNRNLVIEGTTPTQYETVAERFQGDHTR